MNRARQVQELCVASRNTHLFIQTYTLLGTERTSPQRRDGKVKADTQEGIETQNGFLRPGAGSVPTSMRTLSAPAGAPVSGPSFD